MLSMQKPLLLLLFVGGESFRESIDRNLGHAQARVGREDVLSIMNVSCLVSSFTCCMRVHVPIFGHSSDVISRYSDLRSTLSCWRFASPEHWPLAPSPLSPQKCCTTQPTSIVSKVLPGLRFRLCLDLWSLEISQRPESEDMQQRADGLVTWFQSLREEEVPDTSLHLSSP